MNPVLLAQVAEVAPEPPLALLIVHAGAGALALLLGLLAIFTPKPGAGNVPAWFARVSFLHVWCGRGYLAALVVLCVTGVPMLSYQPSYAMVGLMYVSLYLAWSAWLEVGRATTRNGFLSGTRRLINVPVGFAIRVLGLALALWACATADPHAAASIQVDVLCFCVLGVCLLAYLDSRRIVEHLMSIGGKRDFDENVRQYQSSCMRRHIVRMLYSVALTVTVYSVLNMDYLPELVKWLWAPALATLALPVVFWRYKGLLAR